MNETRFAELPPLRTIVIAMDVPEEVLARFRTEFPEIRFIVAKERADGDDAISQMTREDDAIRNADGLIGWGFESKLVSTASRLRWMHAAGAGVEHYDLKDIAARGILLTNSSGVSAPNMAEHVLGMMIALARRFPHLIQAQAERKWRDEATHREVAELLGQTVLIVGIGEIGQEVAQRTAAFGMRVHGLRRRTDAPPPDGFERIFGGDELHSAVAGADHVVVTLPDTPHSRGMFNETVFAAMKPGAMIYNVGRGPVIDTAALITSLESGHMGGAGLDVTDPEPLPEDSALWNMENVFITAHTSGATPQYWQRQSDLIVEIIHRIQEGAQPRNLVDLSAGY